MHIQRLTSRDHGDEAVVLGLGHRLPVLDDSDQYQRTWWDGDTWTATRVMPSLFSQIDYRMLRK